MGAAGVLWVLAYAVAGCVNAPNGTTCVAVHGTANSDPPEELVLEIGNAAWLGFGGVVSVETANTVPVRLVGRESCRVFAQFAARPGSKTVIRFAADGSVRVEDLTAMDIDAGPALPERQLSGCPAA